MISVFSSMHAIAHISYTKNGCKEHIPNIEEKRNADPNPRASPISFVSGTCIRT